MDALFWLFLNFLSLLILAFYSMVEMACVSFNKIRLHYYVNKGMSRAIQLNRLLNEPLLLFGTTLLMVNVALVVGSECSRKFHAAIGLHPDWAPLSQVAIVIVFGELAPMFAARRYAEKVAMGGLPLLYATAWVLRPLLWITNQISKLFKRMVKKRNQDEVILSLEELQAILEEQDEDRSYLEDSEEVTAIARNIFRLSAKSAKEIMSPLKGEASLPSNATVMQLRILLKKVSSSYVLLYHKDLSNIIGIAIPRNLLRAPDGKKVREFVDSPWFVTQNMSSLQILKQFRHNNENLALVLNEKGQTIGVIHRDSFIMEIFGKRSDLPSIPSQQIIDRTLPGEMLVKEVTASFGIQWDQEEELSLAELMERELGRPPEEGDSVYLKPFELTVKETSLLEVKRIRVVKKG